MISLHQDTKRLKYDNQKKKPDMDSCYSTWLEVVFEHFDINRIRFTEVELLECWGSLARQGTEGRFSPVTTPGTHVVNDHMFILQGYEGSLLKVTNKNGKNTSVSTLHGPHALQNILSPPHSRCEGCDRVWSLGDWFVSVHSEWGGDQDTVLSLPTCCPVKIVWWIIFVSINEFLMA